MKLLAIETATEACSVALCIDGEMLLDHRVEPRQHARLLLPMIDALLQSADLRPTALDGIVFGQGPGSFTGVRIAAAAVQGIALGADIGVYGVSTLATMAQGCLRRYGDTAVQVALDARMDEIYHGAYQSRESVGDKGLMRAVDNDQVLRPEAVSALPGSWVLAGSGAERYAEVLRQRLQDERCALRRDCLPEAQDLLVLGRDGVEHTGWQSSESAVPVYLRNRVALTEAERAAGETLN